jgi:hypothetical protein
MKRLQKYTSPLQSHRVRLSEGTGPCLERDKFDSLSHRQHTRRFPEDFDAQKSERLVLDVLVPQQFRTEMMLRSKSRDSTVP